MLCLPSLPAHPLSCIYASTFLAGPKCMVLCTCLQSTPIPNAMVATRIHTHPLSLWNELPLCHFQILHWPARKSSQTNWHFSSCSQPREKCFPCLDFREFYVDSQIEENQILLPGCHWLLLLPGQ